MTEKYTILELNKIELEKRLTFQMTQVEFLRTDNENLSKISKKIRRSEIWSTHRQEKDVLDFKRQIDEKNIKQEQDLLTIKSKVMQR